jgi:hypothetical protein
MKQLVRQLRRWQGRERRYRFAWGFARWAAVVVVGLTACCLIDWTIDLYRDTPFALRVLLTLTQAVGYAVAAYLLVWRLGVPRLDDLAGRAEAAVPAFGHRLVTALQLNRPAAKTAGMSPLLIAEVTREAGELSARHDLAGLAERWRLGRAAALLLPLAVLAGGFVAWKPALTSALLARQCLLDADIPRSVALANETPELWPSGDEVTVRFRVTGAYREDSVGTVRVTPDGQPAESYPLAFDARADDGSAAFVAKLPAASVPFSFRARLRDGRTRADGHVRFEPRPVVTTVEAWLRLPAYVDPDGKRRYERLQPEGEVTALPGCGLRVQAAASKPLAKAEVVLLAREPAGEREAARVPMTLSADRLAAAAVFDIPPKAVAYRVEVADDNGFANRTPPRRGITAAPDDPPRVALLAEVLKDPKEPGPLDDYEVTGMPLVLGGQVQVAYTARSPLGLSRAFVIYRVNEGDWTPLPLKDTVADPAVVGRFLPELGVFENSGPFGQVEFYRLPAADPDRDPPGLEAGGRYNFQTAALTKRLPDGNEAKLEIGDRVEFYVAVYDRNPDPARPAGKSESRIKAVVSQAALEDWNRQRDQSRERLRLIEERQQGVFKPGG